MGDSIIIGGKHINSRGLDVTTWLDEPKLRLRNGEDFRERREPWTRAVVVHTTKGLMPQPVQPGAGPPVDAGFRVSRYWSQDGRNAGAHFVVDHDAKVYQCLDALKDEAFGCPGWNACGVHIEIYQASDGGVYEAQLDAVVVLCDVLTAAIGIQRAVPHRYLGPIKRLLPDYLGGSGDTMVSGVFGHRDLARNRGPGDPGFAIMNRLAAAGYEDFDFSLPDANEGDRATWRRRQRDLGLEPADGIPGPKTRQALRTAGYAHGLWVRRPGDALIA